jgi:adenine-specific DNA-methyltransferase
MATRPARVQHGEVFTRRWVVELMLDLAGYTADRDLTVERVVEPSVGSGAFVGPLLDRLLASRAAHSPHADWMDLAGCLRGWDLQPEHIETTRKLVAKALTDADCPLDTAETLAETWLHAGDFLLSDRHGYRATLVIGNPPYIRIEDLPTNVKAAYKAACPTMKSGRADIFVGFYEHGLDLLEPEGKLVFICADRWMRNDYGKALRAKVVGTGTEPAFAVDATVIMHAVDAFEAEVSAYPAITALRRGEQGPVVTADLGEQFGPDHVPALLAWARSAQKALHTDVITAARLHRWHDSAELWPAGSADTLAWLNELQERFEPLERPDGLTMLRIGVATGNDDVFIVKPADTLDVEPDRLTPIACSDDLRDGKFRWSGRTLIDPWLKTDAKGRAALIDLADYPRTAAYFKAHREALASRHTARGGIWHKTIDRVWHHRVERGFLVLEDLKAKASPVLIPAGFYPHHNLYAIMSSAWDLEVLGGILLSEVFERQIAAWCVKMRGDTLRFQAQYIRKCRFPAPEKIPAEVGKQLAEAFRLRDRDRATSAALLAYDMHALPA